MRSPITVAEAHRHFASPYSRWYQEDASSAEMNGLLACQRLKEPLFTPAISPSFQLQPTDKVFAIGSCFARGVESALSGRGMQILSKAVEFECFPAVNDETKLGFTNKYNTFAMHDELRWALDPAAEFPLQSLVHIGNDKFYDPHTNPALELGDFDETMRRREIIASVTRRISECRIVIITLGLVEVWRDRAANVFINRVIPDMLRCYPDRYELNVTNFAQNLSNLEGIHALLSRFGHPDLQIVVTVSPIPLLATFSGDDVVIANTYSKSVLRAVAEEWASGHKNVHYFPSYEIVQNSDPRLTWEEDRRHVKGKVVQHIMGLFLRNYSSGFPVTSCKLYASPNPVPPGVEPGKTTINWFACGVPRAAVYVSIDGTEEVLFAEGPHGSKEAYWINSGARYDFSLYTGCDRRTQLARVCVTRPCMKPVSPMKWRRLSSWLK